MIWLAYFAIPLVLVVFAWPRRRSLPYPHIFILFAVFILSCGITHLLEAVNITLPLYRLSAVAKILTAIVSWATVFVLVPLVRTVAADTELPQVLLTGKVVPVLQPIRPEGPHPYLVALASVGVATVARYALIPIMDHGSLPFLLYFMATKVSAWYGGFGPCMLAVITSGLAAWYLFMGEPYSFEGLTLAEIAGLGIFVFIGVFTGLVAEALKAARRAAEVTSEVLQDRTKELEDLTIHQETRIADRTKKLADKSQALAASNAELEQFAYVASHDLQEPLRMVASFCQLLEDRYAAKLDDRGKEFIRYAVDGARRMQLLVNDLLAYARVTSQAKPVQPVSAEDVCRRVVESLQMQAGETKAVFHVGKLPMVMADPVQLAQLFQNLLSNAIKFHRPDVPPVVEISRAASAGGLCCFSVKDNGIGISPKHRDKLFVIFQRLHTREEYEGTGIGLALCKKIVERHGGRIWLESEEGVGTTFFFTLPCKGDDDVPQLRRQDSVGGRQPR